MAEIEPYKPGLARNGGLLQQLKEFQKNPRSLVFVALADSYRAEGLPHQAIEILDEGLVYHPGLPSAMVARARCLYDLRRYADALREIQLTLARSPENLKAYKLQAEVYSRLGQRRAAMRALTKVVTLYPQDVEAVRALEELENLESARKIPTMHIGRASVDTPPKPGRIEDFQVGPIAETLAAVGLAERAAGAEAQGESLVRAEAPIEDGAQAPAASAPARAPMPLVKTNAVSFAPSSNDEIADDSEPTFATRTIAELYLRQGLKAKAIKVLRKITHDDPGNAWARETLQDLGSDGIVAPAKPPMPVQNNNRSLERRAKALGILLARVRLLKRVGA